MSVEIVNECVGCTDVGLYCIGSSCPNRRVERHYCDRCGSDGFIAGGLFGISLAALMNINKEKQIMNGAETCVICGKVIPEGCQVCGACMKAEEMDIVDTIRCKDCAKYKPYDTKNGWCFLHEHITNSFNFCEHAVKKEGIK